MLDSTKLESLALAIEMGDLSHYRYHESPLDLVSILLQANESKNQTIYCLEHDTKYLRERVRELEEEVDYYRTNTEDI